MESRRKQRDESMEIYFYDKLAKARRCNLDDEACMEYIVTGLHAEDMVRSLSVREYDNPEELLPCMKRQDERVDTFRETQPKITKPPPMTSRDP